MKLLNEILGTKYPIIQGGMANIATGEFAAACSNAGALGLIGAGGMNAETLRENIRRCKALTDKPFGVNIMLMHPQVDELTPFRELIGQPFDGKKLIAHCEADAGKILLRDCIRRGENVLVLIGPEGDFSKEEIALAYRNGFVPVSLGNSRLRTETAAVVATHSVAFLNEK